MSAKILTVIVPSYNMEKYLPKCLGSLIVVPELMGRLEVLVVNDGSKDSTSRIAHEYEDEYPQTFKVIDKANGHYGSCINAGLRVASGEYVKVLDADDFFFNSAFSEYLRELQGLVAKGMCPDVVFNDYSCIYFGSDEAHVSRWSWAERMILSVASLLPRLQTLQMHGLAYRTNLLREFGYHQTEGVMYTDFEWITYPIPYAKTLYYIPENVYGYLLGREGQSMDAAVLAKNFWMRLKIAGRLEETVNQPDLPEAVGDFYRSVLRRFAPAPYVQQILKAPYRRVNEEIAILDEYVRENCPSLYVTLEAVSLPQRHGFRYLHWWRKFHHLPRIVIACLRLYSWIACHTSR